MMSVKFCSQNIYSLGPVTHACAYMDFFIGESRGCKRNIEVCDLHRYFVLRSTSLQKVRSLFSNHRLVVQRVATNHICYENNVECLKG